MMGHCSTNLLLTIMSRYELTFFEQKFIVQTGSLETIMFARFPVCIAWLSFGQRNFSPREICVSTTFY